MTLNEKAVEAAAKAICENTNHWQRSLEDATAAITALSRTDIPELLSEIERLSAALAEREEALKPFARLAQVFEPPVATPLTPTSGTISAWVRVVDGEYVEFALTVEHLRRARATLTDTQ